MNAGVTLFQSDPTQRIRQAVDGASVETRTMEPGRVRLVRQPDPAGFVLECGCRCGAVVVVDVLAPWGECGTCGNAVDPDPGDVMAIGTAG